MLLSPSSRGEQDQTRERRKSSLIHSLPDKRLSYGSKGSTIYGKYCANVGSRLSQQACSRRSDHVGTVQRDVREKKTRGVVPVFLLVFFLLFSFASHSTIRTPETGYFSTNSQRNASCTGYKKRKFWGTGNGYTSLRGRR